MEKDPTRVARWYFGGLSAIMAATFTHPLDLLKVILQTPSVGKAKTTSLLSTTANIIKKEGVFALYNGLTASWLRQVTYSTTRFGIYEVCKQRLMADGQTNIPFYQKVLLAGFSGACGGFVGTPGDMINVRMQNDIKLPSEERRNYKHAIDGVTKVYKNEGMKALFNGATTATLRAALVTVGQIAMYDQYKQLLLAHMGDIFQDNLVTHFTASSLAGATATTLTQPLDVMKTRMMNAAPGVYPTIGHCARSIFKDLGPMGFFRGYVPAFVRLAPHTILMFVFFEQLRMTFGYLPVKKID
ncbi:Mitochondrial dicarboxylate carrier [Halotydeus destructor]|nr:Mitochondrial dicarboxylate carrier [Halotydeus destructor]